MLTQASAQVGFAIMLIKIAFAQDKSPATSAACKHRVDAPYPTIAAKQHATSSSRQISGKMTDTKSYAIVCYSPATTYANPCSLCLMCVLCERACVHKCGIFCSVAVVVGGRRSAQRRREHNDMVIA